MTTGTFGAIPEKRWDDGERQGWELPNPFPELPTNLWNALSDELQDDISAWHYSLAMDVRTLRPHLPNSAVHHIVTAVVADASALVVHVDRYEGRSAAHAARALFEHLVNLMDVTTSSTNTGERYLDHRYVTADQVSRRRWYFPLLDRKSARQEKDRLDKLGRKAARPLADALAKWGSGFRRGWAYGSLYDRASTHGLVDSYDGYRILSGVIHGSAGGLSGLVREVRGEPVHRIGPDIQLAAAAYREGLLAVYGIADHLLTVTGRPEAERLRGLTGNLLNSFQEVADELRLQDNRLWPTTPPPGRITVAGVFPSGRVRWYVWDLLTDTIAVAEPPETEPEALVKIKNASRGSDFGGVHGRPITVTFEGDFVRVEAKEDAPWLPAAGIVVPIGHPARFDKPIVHTYDN